MADQNQSQPDGSNSQTQQESPIPQNTFDNPPKDQINASSPNQACRYEPQQPPNIIVQREQIDDTQAKRANRIAYKMFVATVIASIVSLGVLIATAYIWSATKDSVKVAQDALTDGRRKDSISRIIDSSSSIRQDSIFKVNRLDVQNRFRLDSFSAANQINIMRSTLAETKKEFEAVNTPYLQVANPTILVFRDGQTIRIAYSIENLKEFPVKIKGFLTMTTWMPRSADDSMYNAFCKRFNISKDTDTLRLANKYVIKQAPIYDTVAMIRRLKPNEQQKILAGTWNLVFLGGVKYTDLATGNIRLYRFQIIFDRWMEPTFIENENIIAPKR